MPSLDVRVCLTCWVTAHHADAEGELTTFPDHRKCVCLVINAAHLHELSRKARYHAHFVNMGLFMHIKEIVFLNMCSLLQPCSLIIPAFLRAYKQGLESDFGGAHQRHPMIAMETVILRSLSLERIEVGEVLARNEGRHNVNQ